MKDIEGEKKEISGKRIIYVCIVANTNKINGKKEKMENNERRKGRSEISRKF